MKQQPTIGHLLPPADVPRVFPQQLHLPVCVASVPQRVPHHLSRPRVRLNQLQLDAWFSHCPEWCRLPVSLSVLLPHHRVELIVVLVAEDEPDIVVINFSVNKEGSLKVDAPKPVEANRKSRIRVHCLNNFCSLVVNHPVRVNLGVPVRVENHRLVGPEVCGIYLAVVGAVIHEINNVVSILIVLTDVTLSVAILVKLLRIVLDPAVVSFIHDSVIIRIRIALISRPIFVCIMLIRIWTVRTVVQGIWDSILVLIVVCVTNVSKPVSVRVLLVQVCNQWTVVSLIENSVI